MSGRRRLVVVSWLIAATCFAQESALPQPKTKLEQFQGKVGSVLLTNSTNVGSLDGKLGSSVRVEARKLTDSSDHSQLTGLAITVSDQRRGGRRSTSYIDLDEIDSLLKAIDTIEQVAKSAGQRVDYRTNGDFAISRLVSERFRGIITAVQSGLNPPVRANFDLDDLHKLKELIAKAQSALQSSKEKSD